MLAISDRVVLASILPRREGFDVPNPCSIWKQRRRTSALIAAATSERRRRRTVCLGRMGVAWGASALIPSCRGGVVSYLMSKGLAHTHHGVVLSCHLEGGAQGEAERLGMNSRDVGQRQARLSSLLLSRLGGMELSIR